MLAGMAGGGGGAGAATGAGAGAGGGALSSDAQPASPATASRQAATASVDLFIGIPWDGDGGAESMRDRFVGKLRRRSAQTQARETVLTHAPAALR